jgi:hypothetical protein
LRKYLSSKQFSHFKNVSTVNKLEIKSEIYSK